MSKAKTVPAGRRRHRKYLKRAKGFVGGRSRLYRSAREAVQRALAYGTRDRRDKKGTFRRLWITRISAGTEEMGLSYNRFIDGLKKAKIELNRKILADLALNDKPVFQELVKIAKG